MGYPVALKAIGPALLHKTERNAVRLDLSDAAAVRAVAHQLETQLAGEMSGMLVQRMVPGGVEMLVGAIEDPTFGPMVVCGSGGVLVELLGDSAFRLHPLTDRDASEMVGELKGAALLRGFRGAPPADEPALRETFCVCRRCCRFVRRFRSSTSIRSRCCARAPASSTPGCASIVRVSCPARDAWSMRGGHGRDAALTSPRRERRRNIAIDERLDRADVDRRQAHSCQHLRHVLAGPDRGVLPPVGRRGLEM